MPEANQPTNTSDPNPALSDAADKPAESTANLEDIASDLAATMPEVQPHAVEQAALEARAAESSPTDRAGVRFDPNLHAADASGKGSLTARGTWRLKGGRGRKAGSAAPVGGSSMAATSGTPAAVDAKAAQVAQSRAAGVAAAEMLFMTGQIVGGEEWAPIKNEKLGMDERAMMQQAFGDYFVATNKKDIPPGAALGFCLIAYIAPRFTMPKTQARFGMFKQKIVQWWINRKLRKQGMQAEVKPAPTKEG